MFYNVWLISASVLCLKSLVIMLNFTVTVASGCTYCKRTSACWWVRDQVLWNCKFLPESDLFSDSHSSLTTEFCVLQSAKTNLNVEQVFFSIARDIKQRLAETDSKPEVQIIAPIYIWNSISTYDLSSISLRTVGEGNQDSQASSGYRASSWSAIRLLRLISNVWCPWSLVIWRYLFPAWLL